jgi:hypothetical protein
MSHLNRMLYGQAPDGVRTGEHRSWALLTLCIPFAILVLLGVVLPTPISALLQQTTSSLAP